MICMEDTVVALSKDELMYLVSTLSQNHPNIRVYSDGQATVISHNDTSCEVTALTVKRAWEKDFLEERFSIKVNLASLGFAFSTVLDFSWAKHNYQQLLEQIAFWLDLDV